MGLEGNGGPRTSDAPAFRGGLRPTMDGVVPAAIGSPKDLAALFARRAPAAVTFQRGYGIAPHAVNVNGGNGAFSTEVQPTQERQFTSNLTLDAICDLIRRTPPDWQKLVRTLPTATRARAVRGSHGKLAELHIDSLFDEIPSQFGRVCDPTALDGKKTKSFVFERDAAGHITVLLRNRSRFSNHARVTEYDHFRVIDGLPTVFEVKAQMIDERTNPLSNSLEMRNAASIFNPLREAFGTNTFGFVVITVPERLSPDSELQQRFRANGGQLVPMRATYQELLYYASIADLSPHRAPLRSGRSSR